jgi:NAD(P)-dependent dehydrogenase (short-subunit alcohol dehydrogenase family)
MKILVLGASGTIGARVAEALGARHDIVRASRSGDVRVDLGDPSSIAAMYRAVSDLDAVVCAAGAARFGKLETLTDDDFAFSLANKLMGQVNVVRLGMPFLRDGGSFTLTSGVLAQKPAPGTAAISLVNAGVEAFARAAAIEPLPRNQRVNVVSPPWVSETLVALGRDPAGGLPAEQVARAYVASVESRRSGEILDPADFA